MKALSTILILFSLLLSMNSCKKDCIEYVEYPVDFFICHPEFILESARFEEVTEQVLTKQAYRPIGVIFETVSEQVLLREEYTLIKIADRFQASIVTDAENLIIEEIDCHHFYEEPEFIFKEVPAEYVSRTYQRVFKDGTGELIPATYSTRSYFKLIKDAELIPKTNERSFKTVNFRIPDSSDLRSHVMKQLEQNNLDACIEGNSYRI